METAPPPPPSDAYVPGQTPGVIIWYRVYLIVMCLLFLVVAGAGAALTFGAFPVTAEDLDGTPPELLGGIYLVMGLLMLIPFIVALFIPRKPWAWIYHIVMIGIGMTGCTLVGCIPLLIFWLKPNVKGYFGRPY